MEALMSLDEAASHLADARNRLGNALRRVGLEEKIGRASCRERV